MFAQPHQQQRICSQTEEDSDIEEILSFLGNAIPSGEEGALLNTLADEHEETIDTQLEGLQKILLEEAMAQKEQELLATIQELKSQLQAPPLEVQTREEEEDCVFVKETTADDRQTLAEQTGKVVEVQEDDEEDNLSTCSSEETFTTDGSETYEDLNGENRWGDLDDEQTWDDLYNEEEAIEGHAKKIGTAQANWKKALLFCKTLSVLKKGFLRKSSDWSDVADSAQKSTKLHLHILDRKNKHKAGVEEWEQNFGKHEGESDSDWLWRLAKEHGKYNTLCRNFSKDGTCIHESAHGTGSCDFLHVPQKPKTHQSTEKTTQPKKRKNKKKTTTQNKSANSFDGLYDSDDSD
jgi:hypothetical protein